MMDVENIGGAFVRRTFTRMTGGALRHMRSGEVLSADEVVGMGEGNRRAMIDAGYIEVWPKPPIEAVGSDGDGQRFIVHLGRGSYDVIEGQKLNDEPLTKEAAEELATRP